MGKGAFGDEQRAAREYKIRPEHDDHRTRETVGPIGLAVSDEREEYVPKCCEKRANTCGRSIQPGLKGR